MKLTQITELIKQHQKTILITVAGVVAAGGLLTAGVLAYQGQHAKSIVANSTTSPSPTKTAAVSTSTAPTITATSTPDPTANWDTYTLSGTAISFKHPKDWNVITDIVDKAVSPGARYVRLQSSSTQKDASNSSFYLSFYLRDNTTYLDTVTRVVADTQKVFVNGKAAFIVDGGNTTNDETQVSMVYLTDTPVEIGQQVVLQNYITTSNAELSMYGGYGKEAVALSAPINQWDSYPEVQIAKQIITTLKY